MIFNIKGSDFKGQTNNIILKLFYEDKNKNKVDCVDFIKK